jgi:hypothetical protein
MMLRETAHRIVNDKLEGTPVRRGGGADELNLTDEQLHGAPASPRGFYERGAAGRGSAPLRVSAPASGPRNRKAG